MRAESRGQALPSCSAVPARAIEPFAKDVFKAFGRDLALPAAVGIEARCLRIWRETERRADALVAVHAPDDVSAPSAILRPAPLCLTCFDSRNPI